MERHFLEELEQLKAKILKMSGLVEEALSLAIKAFSDRDEALAQKVVDSDPTINLIEIAIDDLCMRFLALHQPQARDLRFIAAIMKINSDLERMGDLAVNIAQRTLDLLKVPPIKPPVNIFSMATAAQGMLKDSIDAFVNNDTDLAISVCKRDDFVDDLNSQIFRELLHLKAQDQTTIERVVDLILVAKNLERIADHATNISEDVIYMVDGKVIKHHIAD